MSIEALYNELSEAQSNWGELYDSLRRAQYDTAAAQPAIDNISVDNMHRKAILVFDILNALRPRSEDEACWAVFSARLAETRSALGTFSSHIQTPLNQIRSYQREHLTIRDQTGNFSWQFFEDQTNIASVDLSGSFQHANIGLNGLVNNVSYLLPICKADAVGDLSKRAQALSAVVSEIEGFRSEAQKLAKATSVAHEKAHGHEKSIQDVLVGMQTTYAAIQAIQQQADKENASITALIAQIKSTGANADTLEQLIAGYRSKFEAFQTQLDARLEEFKQFENNVSEVGRQQTTREAEIDRLIDKADSMIKGATTAGLSKSLEDTQAIYAKRMLISGIGFLVSIILLAISALPLAAHLLPGLLGDWIPAITDDVKNSPVSVLGKAVLLLPATWLSIFFSKAFSEFFHLEREYAHKAALAKSVEGFKREAPDFEQEITTGVFGEILNNPSSRKSPEPANHPIYEVLTKRLIDWLGKKSVR